MLNNLKNIIKCTNQNPNQVHHHPPNTLWHQRTTGLHLVKLSQPMPQTKLTYPPFFTPPILPIHRLG